MKLSRFLTLVAVGTAIGLYLTRTQQGRQLRSQMNDRAADWGDKLNRMRQRTVDDLAEYAREGKNTLSRTTSDLNS